jgi:hypothetical protein
MVAAPDSRGTFTLGRVSGVFTVSDFKTVNGVSQASGWLTANVTGTGTNQIGTFTNLPVRMPVSGILAGDPVEVGIIDNPVILPQLSTNTCELLGIVVGDVDVTIPGLGLNLHVNEISIVVRSDRETTIGELLCNVLGDGLLGKSKSVSSATAAPQSGVETPSTSSPNALTTGQLRGLIGIMLGTGVSRITNSAASPLASGGASSGKRSSPLHKDPKLGLLQNFLQQVISTMDPAKAGTSTSGQTSAPAVGEAKSMSTLP